MADAPTPAQGEHTDPSGDDQRLANLVNAAVSSHLKRSLGKAIEESVAPLREQLAAFQTPKPEAPKPASGGDSEALRQVEELRGQLKKERETAAKERRLAREEKAFGELRSELAGKVRPEALDNAAKLLFHADKRVKVAEDGQVTFHHGDAEYGLKEGVAEWVRSKDASMFLPAPSPTARRPVPGKTPTRQPGSAPVTNESPLAKTQRMLAELQSRG